MPRAETWGFEAAQADGTGVLARAHRVERDPVARHEQLAVHAPELVPARIVDVFGREVLPLQVEAETAGFAVVPLPEGFALEAVIRVVADASRGAGFAEWVRPRA